MEIKIFDSILHGELKPWTLDTTDTRRFTALIRKAGEVSPSTNAEIQNQLAGLLQDFPILHNWITAQEFPNNKLQSLVCTAQLPDSTSPVTRFYATIISAETIRLYNAFINYPADWNKEIDIPFQTGRLLNSLKVLTKQTNEELKERGFTSEPNSQSHYTHFALHYLKHSLIQLYFAIQKYFEKELPAVTSPEDFYSLDLEEDLSNMLPLDFPTSDRSDKQTKKTKKLSFQFTGNPEKLKTAINQLCRHCELVNESINTQEQLFTVLTSKDLRKDAVKITIGCETTQFRHILEALKTYFSNFKFSTIEHSGVFISKNGTPITAQNLYASKIDNPKTKEEIDSIINQMK
ncbi:MAG: hypothetical protein JST57_05030 [Bacteroidetes bacterium]|nr:hypothetical protein [Bacteroidota bacterium]